MKRYGNLFGNSSAVAYEYDDRKIRVLFKNGKTYDYYKGFVGADAFAKMCACADRGWGLVSFINNWVRYQYSRRW